MKKIITILLCVCLLGTLAFSFTACTPREEILRVYNWGEYMHKDTWKGFEDWYKEKTGKNIKVKYDTFDINETMYTQIATKKADYDLICPSDYMLERMKNEGLIEKLEEDTIAIVNEAVQNDELKARISFDTGLEYSMPYMWGTIGIMYNIKAAPQNVDSWDALFTDPGSKKVWMKDSVRDSYSAAMLSHFADDLIQLRDEYGYESTEYQNKLNQIFAPDLSAANKNNVLADIKTAKDILTAQKPYVKGYDVDNAKNDLLADEDGENGEFGLFWSCDAGYIMAGVEEAPRCGGSGSSDINYNLRYVVPEGGSNLWLDCFAIPTTAGNKSAANLFIQYLCDVDVAIECMEESGSTSAITEAAAQYEESIAEMDFFKNAPKEFQDNFMDMMFPSEETLKRCAVMRDFGEYNLNLDEMWQAIYTA